jgi:hypothetical protein
MQIRPQGREQDQPSYDEHLACEQPPERGFEGGSCAVLLPFVPARRATVKTKCTRQACRDPVAQLGTEETSFVLILGEISTRTPGPRIALSTCMKLPKHLIHGLMLGSVATTVGCFGKIDASADAADTSVSHAASQQGTPSFSGHTEPCPPSPGVDAGPPEPTPLDAGPPEPTPLDAGPPEPTPLDAGPPEPTPLDAGPPEPTPFDAGAPDADVESCPGCGRG